MSIIINNKKILGTEPSVNTGDLGLFAGADDQFYVKKSDGTTYALGSGSASSITSVEIINNQLIFTEANGATFGASGSFTGGGGSFSIVAVTYSTLSSLINSNSLDLGTTYKLTDPGTTFSLCVDGTVVNVGRGNVYLKPLSNSIIDPNGVWEAEFKYTAKWLMNLSEYDFDRVWKGKTMSSLIITPDDFIGGDPIITFNELLSSTVSFGTTLQTFVQNLETSINNNSINSGWEVYGWTISYTSNINDYESFDINTISSPLSVTFSVLSMIIESSSPTSSYFENQVLSNYGTGYTFPPYGILGTPSLNFKNQNWYITQNGLDATTYSLPCIYDVLYNDLMEVRDPWGNIWRGSPEFLSIGVSSIYDYPIFSPGLGLNNQLINCIIDSCFINAYNFIGSLAYSCNLKSIYLGIDALSGPSITNSQLTGNIVGEIYDSTYGTKIMDSSVINVSSKFMNYKQSVICNSIISENFYSEYSVIMGSKIIFEAPQNVGYQPNNTLTLKKTILRDNISISDSNFVRSSPNFSTSEDLLRYGKTFSIVKSNQSGFFEIGYQTPYTATASTDIGVSFYLIEEYPGFTSSLLFTTSVATFSKTNFNVNKMISTNDQFWTLLMAFDTDVSVDKISFSPDNVNSVKETGLGPFNVYVKKL